MRRGEIEAALIQEIDASFPEDCAKVFDYDRLDGLARMIQSDFDPDNARDIHDLVQNASRATGRDLDALADGEVNDPNHWLELRIKANN